MKYVKVIFILPLFIFFLNIFGFSQEQKMREEPAKKWVYEFHVSGMKSPSDAEKLDNTMIRMKGIYSCKTDFSTNKVVVSCIPLGDYLGLQIMVQSLGFVTSDHYIFKEE